MEQEARLAEIKRMLGVNEPEPTEDSQLAGWQDLLESKQSGLLDFGSHSMNHRILSHLSSSEQELEIVDSRRLVLERLGSCDFFAYPNGTPGDFNKRSIEIIKRSGYLGAVTAGPGLVWRGDNPYVWPRIGMGPRMSRAHFALRAAGVHGRT